MNTPAAILELKYPFQWGRDEIISELHFRRIKARDLRQIDGMDEMAVGLQMIANTAGLTPKQVDELDGEDLMEALKIVKGFMPKSRETGEKSSDGSPTE